MLIPGISELPDSWAEAAWGRNPQGPQPCRWAHGQRAAGRGGEGEGPGGLKDCDVLSFLGEVGNARVLVKYRQPAHCLLSQPQQHKAFGEAFGETLALCHQPPRAAGAPSFGAASEGEGGEQGGGGGGGLRTPLARAENQKQKQKREIYFPWKIIKTKGCQACPCCIQWL